MKLLTALFAVLIFSSAYSQKTDSLKGAADAAIKAFTWDIEKAEKGALMFLDVPYNRDNSDSTEYLTLTVAKYKSQERPAFISVIIPANVVKSNGIFIAFAKNVVKDGQRTMEIDKSIPMVRAAFERCTNEDCTARLVGGYATRDNSEKVDVLQGFLNYDHVLFLFVYPDGSHKSVAVPLFKFKEQYKSL